MGFPRQEYWSVLPFPSPEELPDLGIKPASPVLAGRFLTAEPLGKPNLTESCLDQFVALSHLYYFARAAVTK